MKIFNFKSIVFFAAILLSSTSLLAANSITKFKINKPHTGQKSKVMYLWATYYHIHYAKAKKRKGHRLKKVNGKNLGPKLSSIDFCKGAMQGTVKVKRLNGKKTVYNYDGVAKKAQVKCGKYYPKMPKRIKRVLGKTRFRLASGAYGDGTKNYILKPFRTIAVDKARIPYGTLIYIPSAKGVRFKFNGRRYRHDGYFFAADTGGAIKNRHIDVFLGNNTRNPFKFIKNKKQRRFKAYIVWNRKLKKRMRQYHLNK